MNAHSARFFFRFLIFSVYIFNLSQWKSISEKNFGKLMKLGIIAQAEIVCLHYCENY